MCGKISARTRNMKNGGTRNSQSRSYKWTSGRILLFVLFIDLERLEEKEEASRDKLNRGKGEMRARLLFSTSRRSSQLSVTLDVVAPVSAIVALVIHAYKTVLNGIKS